MRRTLLALGLALAALAAQASRDYGLPGPNLLRNGSFEDGMSDWETLPAARDAYAVRDGTFPHAVALPYWEGRPAFYRPADGASYLELTPADESVSVAQEAQRLTPGRYVLVAHVRGHAGSVIAEPARFPRVHVDVTDAKGRSLLHEEIDWVAARQGWVLVASALQVATARVRVSLALRMPPPPAGETGVQVTAMFDDIRFLRLRGSETRTLRAFAAATRLDLSAGGAAWRVLGEEEYATGDLPPRRMAASREALSFGGAWQAAAGSREAVAGRDGAPDAIALRMPGDATALAQLVRDVPPPRAERAHVAMSAWVWSEVPRSASLRLEYGDKTADSAFHSGSGRWEHLTVVAPYALAGETLRVSLRAEAAEARFEPPVLLALTDDRFDGLLPPQDMGGGRLRERVAYRKDPGRVRIVFVGNSTVNGVAFVAHHASFPYILQLKLETLFPGRFEVVNYGVGAGGLLDQLLSVDHYFKFAANDTNYYVSLVNPSRQETPDSLAAAARDALGIAALRPDVVVIGSMWNDLDRLFDPRVRDRDYALVDRLLALADAPSAGAYASYGAARAALTERLAQLGGNGATYAYSWSAAQPYEALSRDPAFYANARRAEALYGHLLEAFVARALHRSAVWSLVLPANGGRKGLEFFDRFPDLMLKADGVTPENAKAIVFYRQECSAIQARAGQGVALRHGIPNLDLAAGYDAAFEDADAAAWARTGYFVPDLLHFTYRGNEWIADEIFRTMEARFETLANARR